MYNLVNLKTFSMASLAVLAILLTSVESKANTVGICNTDGVGQCTASVNLIGNTFTIQLTNTSSATGPFITAAAFNLTAGTTVNTFSSTDLSFLLYGPAPTGWTGNVSPDPDRTHLISATGNDYNGGGSPNDGTGIGQTVTFTLTLASLNGNTEASIFNSLLVRNRGGVDSDKDNLVVVPEPATMLLLGTGLVGIAAGIRRRRR